MCEAESVTLYFSRAIPYGFSFLFYKWKKTFEPFIRKIPYKSWFIYTITLVYTSKLQNSGLASQFSIHCCLKRESGRIFLKQINSVLRTSSRSHVVSFLDFNLTRACLQAIILRNPLTLKKIARSKYIIVSRFQDTLGFTISWQR